MIGGDDAMELIDRLIAVRFVQYPFVSLSTMVRFVT